MMSTLELLTSPQPLRSGGPVPQTKGFKSPPPLKGEGDLGGEVIHIFYFLLSFFFLQNATAQTISPERMQQVYEEIKTPHKYGLIITPTTNEKKLDCPTVFRKGKGWYMTYLIYDGRGYETWLAKSSDLLNWTTLGRLMSFADTDTTHWDSNQRAGYVALQNTKWDGNYKLQKYDSRYWMPYLGSNTRGYEEGKLSLGMAFTTNLPHKVAEWQRLPKPTLTPDDPDVRWWENKKLYKSTVIWDKKKTTGYPFVLYYNANGDTSNNNPKYRLIERIGMAVSNDMKTWKRFGQDPVIDHQSGISGDAVLQKMGDLWVMFYFGAFWNDRKDAYNRFACSYDLVNWTKWEGVDLIAPSEPYDSMYAHKSYVIKHKGIVYHFYCAVNKHDQRGIAVATSKDVGKSKLSFVAPPPPKKK